MTMHNDFEAFLRQRSREIAPDYPNINNDLTPYEHLWAITSSYEGTSKANDDLHRFIDFLLANLQWTHLEALEKWKAQES